MDVKVMLVLANLAGVGLVWLLAFAYYYAWRRRTPAYQPSRQARVFIVVPTWRWLALLAATLAVIFPLLFLFLLPANHFEQRDWFFVFWLGALTGGLLGVLAYQQWAARCYFDEQGVWGLAGYGFPRYIAWSAVQSVTFSQLRQSYKLQGVGKPVYLSKALDEQDELGYALWQHLPAGVIQVPLSRQTEFIDPNPNGIVVYTDTTHLKEQSLRLYRHASKFALAASLLFVLTLFLVKPNVLMLSVFVVLCGLILGTAYIVVLWPQASDRVLNSMHIVSVVLVAVIIPQLRLHSMNAENPESYLSFMQWLKVLLQEFSFGFAVAFLGLVLIRRYQMKTSDKLGVSLNQ